MLPAKLNVTVWPADSSGVSDSLGTGSFDVTAITASPAPIAADPARVVAAVAGPPALAVVLVIAFGLGPVAAALLVAAAVAVSIVVTLRHVVAPLRSAVLTDRAKVAQLEVRVAEHQAERDFRDRLERALERCEAEPATLRTGLRAVAELVPDAEVALLLNVPDEPRIGWSVRLSGGSLDAAVPVPSTPTCSALTAGASVVTTSSSALDACAHLHDPAMDVSATCVPLRLGDRLLGSVCIVDAPGDALDPELLGRLEWVVAPHRCTRRRTAPCQRPGPSCPTRPADRAARPQRAAPPPA